MSFDVDGHDDPFREIKRHTYRRAFEFEGIQAPGGYDEITAEDTKYLMELLGEEE